MAAYIRQGDSHRGSGALSARALTTFVKAFGSLATGGLSNSSQDSLKSFSKKDLRENSTKISEVLALCLAALDLPNSPSDRLLHLAIAVDEINASDTPLLRGVGIAGNQINRLEAGFEKVEMESTYTIDELLELLRVAHSLGWKNDRMCKAILKVSEEDGIGPHVFARSLPYLKFVRPSEIEILQKAVELTKGRDAAQCLVQMVSMDALSSDLDECKRLLGTVLGNALSEVEVCKFTTQQLIAALMSGACTPSLSEQIFNSISERISTIGSSQIERISYDFHHHAMTHLSMKSRADMSSIRPKFIGSFVSPTVESLFRDQNLPPLCFAGSPSPGRDSLMTLLKLTRDLSDEHDPSRPRRSVPKNGFKAQLINHAVAATKLVSRDEMSAWDNDKSDRGSVIVANFFDTLAARAVSLSSSLTAAEIGVIMAAFSRVGVYHEFMMETLRSRLFVDRLIDEAQPSTIAAVCWSYVTFNRIEGDAASAIAERLRKLLQFGDVLQLNGHGFIGIIRYLSQLTSQENTGVLRRLVEVQLSTALVDMSASNLSALLVSFVDAHYPTEVNEADIIRQHVTSAVVSSLPWFSPRECVEVGKFYSEFIRCFGIGNQESTILAHCLGSSVVTECRDCDSIAIVLSCIASLSAAGHSGIPGCSLMKTRTIIGQLLRSLDSAEVGESAALVIARSCCAMKIRREKLQSRLMTILEAAGAMTPDLRDCFIELEINST
ncbi:hypothetical protein FOL47_002381 [Perkinsus chesapeaki]|uniref:Uncharacterized protein n=1 Tax=Perkinsus chesapeaki TaxID=330153 RepID=A0A7J6MFG0_PERCH|nr:hypothetical protein FOL47_002381 [Perkinsus chesapeaki]